MKNPTQISYFTLFGLALAGLGWLFPAVVHAQAQPTVGRQESMTSFGSRRSKARPTMIMPEDSLTIGAELGFVTADGGLGDGSLGDGKVRFTDLVLFRPRVRYAPGKKFELFAGTTLVPKQPSDTDELVWQGANLGTLIELSPRWAMFLQAAGGPLMNDAGWWTGMDAGVQARKILEQVVVFQGALGGSGSMLIIDGPNQEPFWFAEVASHGEILFQAPRGEVAGWLGVDYRVPLAKNPATPDPAFGGYLDPQPRVNVALGVVLAFLPNWDIYAEFAIIDRGDLDAPATTLPVLDGGFDQRHLVFGLLRRFRAQPTVRAMIAR